MSFIRRDCKLNSSTMSSTNKFSTISSIRKILKPILRILKIKQHKTTQNLSTNEILDNNFNTSLEDMRNECAITEEIDNTANEALEQKLFEEINKSVNSDAIYICNGSKQNLVHIDKEEKFIPVHFVRTNNGTFFWTSTENTNIPDDITSETITNNRCSESSGHHLDRWVQA